MKRFILFVTLLGAAASGFLWWKRREIAKAESVTQDPWPSAVTSSVPIGLDDIPVTKSPESTDSQPVAKKVVKKAVKRTTKKEEADPTQ